MKILFMFFICVLFLLCVIASAAHFYNDSIGWGIFWLGLSSVNLVNIVLTSKHL